MEFQCKYPVHAPAWAEAFLFEFWVRRTPCRYYLAFVNEAEVHLHVEYWKRDNKPPYGKWVTLCLDTFKIEGD